MITVRPLPATALERIGEIDRSEHVTEEVVHRDGRLRVRAVDIRVPPWSPDGDPEHSVPGRIAAWRPLLARGGTLLGALDADTLVGFAIYRPHLADGLANLAVLHVSRPHRRQGVASRLVDEVVRLARADGARRLYVSATPSGSTVAFYRRHGFAPTDQPDAGLHALEPDDIHMIREL